MDAEFSFQEDTIDLRQYAAVLWRWKWLLIACTLLAAGAAFLTSRLMTPVYQATTTILVNEAPDSQTSDYTALLTSERLARTYAQMLTKRPVLQETLDRLGISMDLEELEGAVEVQLVRDTQLIEVNVEDTSPNRAAELANTLVAVFIEQNDALQASRYAASKESMNQQLSRLQSQIQETQAAIEALAGVSSEKGEAELARLQTELAQLQSSYTNLLQSYEALRLEEARSVSNVVQVEPAAPPEKPVRPRTLLNTALAAVVGAMLAVGAVFLLEYLDDSVKSTEQASRLLGLPVIGFIARRQETDGELVVVQEPRSPIAEAFRALRTNIKFASVDHPIRTLLVTSTGPEEGKTTVAANLALVMAQGGKRVLLLDADLRRPRIHKILNIANHKGITDLFVRSQADFENVIRPWREKNLSVLTSGDLPPNPAELLGSRRMSELLSAMTDRFDMLIIDSAPAGVVTDAAVLAEHVDGVLIVIQPGKSSMPASINIVEQLRRAGANLIGLVFNNVPMGRAGYYGGRSSGYYYHYSSGYAYGEDGRKEGRRGRRGRKGDEERRSRGGVSAPVE